MAKKFGNRRGGREGHKGGTRELVSHSTRARGRGRGENLHPRRDEVKEKERRRGPRRPPPPTKATAGEMTLGPRGAHNDLYSGHDLDVGGGEEEEKGFPTNTLECSP